MYFKKKYIFILSAFLLLAFIVVKQRAFIANEIRIITCQPNFTKVNDKLKKEILDITYGTLNFIVNGCPYEKLNIKIKKENLEILENDRKRFIQSKILFKPNSVPATIVWNKKKIKSRIRIKGDLLNNWNFKKKFSLKITLDKPYSINGMSEFSLTKFAERQFPVNLIISEQLSDHDIIVPKFHSYKVNFDNSNWGLMLAEEQFSDFYYSSRSIDKNPILKFTDEIAFKINNYIFSHINNSNDIKLLRNLSNKQGTLKLKIYNSKDFINNKKYEDFISIARSIKSLSSDNNLKNYHSDKIYRFLDIDKFTDYFLTILIWGEFHSHYFTNMRFYFNPKSFMIEPIPTDHTDNLVAHNNFEEYLNAMDNFYKIIIKSDEFKSKFKKKLDNFNEDYFNRIENRKIKLCDNFKTFEYQYQQCLKKINVPVLKKNLDYLKFSQLQIFDNIKLNFDKNYIDINITKKQLMKLENFILDIPFYTQNIFTRIFDDGELRFYNLTPFDVMINEITLFGSSNKYLVCKKYIENKNCIKKKIKIKTKIKPIDKMNYVTFKVSSLKNLKAYSWVKITNSVNDNQKVDFFDIEKKIFKPEIFFGKLN